MFPETFVEKHLAASRHDGVVFDPFCGRGTTIFESLIRGRSAAGCDVHPVAVCISGAKSDPPLPQEVRARLRALREMSEQSTGEGRPSKFEDFFSLCFAPGTLRQILFLRKALDWETCKIDRFIAALALGALHGESHKSPNYFSNRMPRTISTKPAYSVRWWRRHGYEPPVCDVFGILNRMSEYRFASEPPVGVAYVRRSDARQASVAFPHLENSVTDIITSPPYLDTTNYREDQWLRCWFLGEEAFSKIESDDGRHTSFGRYWRFLTEAWAGVASLLAPEARIVVRIGGRRLEKEELRNRLIVSLQDGTDRDVTLIDLGITSDVKRSQANSFRGTKPSATVEHDFCFHVA